MAVCSKCGTPHDPDLACPNPHAEPEQRAVEVSNTTEDFKPLQKTGSRALVRTLLVLVTGLALLILAIVLFRR